MALILHVLLCWDWPRVMKWWQDRKLRITSGIARARYSTLLPSQTCESGSFMFTSASLNPEDTNREKGVGCIFPIQSTQNGPKQRYYRPQNCCMPGCYGRTAVNLWRGRHVVYLLSHGQPFGERTGTKACWFQPKDVYTVPKYRIWASSGPLEAA